MEEERNLAAVPISTDEYNMGMLMVLASMILSWIFIYRWSQRSKKGPKTWPLVGAAIEQLMNYDRMHDWLVKYLADSRTVVVPMPFTTYTYIADPANVEYVLKTNFANFPKGEVYHSYMEVLLGDGIFNVDGELWRKQRKTASFEFASKQLRDFSTIVFREYSLKLADILSRASFQNQEVDLQEFLMRMTLDSICKVGFGVEIGTLAPHLPENRFAQAFDTANIIVTLRFIDPVPYSMGRMEYNWGPDAASFKPERWLKDGFFQNASPFKFTAFQAGPRICLGKDSAYLQMKMALAILCRFFKFDLVPGHPVKYRMMTILSMAHGLKVTASVRP